MGLFKFNWFRPKFLEIAKVSQYYFNWLRVSKFLEIPIVNQF